MTTALTLSSDGSTVLAFWSALSDDETGDAYEVDWRAGLGGCIDFTGTWGGATATLQKSNDGITWFTVKALDNLTDVSATDDASFEFTTAGRYLRTVISGGSSAEIKAAMVLRG